MACSTLFRGNNQIAALLAPADDRIILADTLSSAVNGLVLYEGTVQTIITELKNSQFEALKKCSEYGRFKTSFGQFIKNSNDILQKGHDSVLDTSEMRKHVDQIDQMIQEIVRHGSDVVEKCNELSGKRKTADYTPAPTVEIPVVCNNEKAPPSIMTWLEATDDDVFDKQVVCQVDPSMIARLTSLASKYGGDKTKATAKTIEATKSTAFHVNLKLSNGFRVKIIEGSFVGIARSDADRIGDKFGNRVPFVTSALVSILYSTLVYVAKQTYNTVSALGGLVTNTIISTIEAAANTRFGKWVGNTVLGDWTSKQMRKAWKSLKKNKQWYPYLRGGAIGVVLVCAYYVFPTALFYDAFVKLAYNVLSFMGVTVLAIGDSFSTQNKFLATFFIPKALALTNIYCDQLGWAPEKVRVVIKVVIRGLYCVLRFYQILAFGRAYINFLDGLDIPGWFQTAPSLPPPPPPPPISDSIPVFNTMPPPPISDSIPVFNSTKWNTSTVHDVFVNNSKLQPVFEQFDALDNSTLLATVQRFKPAGSAAATAAVTSSILMNLQQQFGVFTVTSHTDPSTAYVAETMGQQFIQNEMPSVDTALSDVINVNPAFNETGAHNSSRYIVDNDYFEGTVKPEQQETVEPTHNPSMVQRATDLVQRSLVSATATVATGAVSLWFWNINSESFH
jgi:hypothetical protein